MKIQAVLCALFVAAAGLIGCASGVGCGPLQMSMSITPGTATVNHDATAPGNQQKFSAAEFATAQPGCATPALGVLVIPTWTSSDPLDVQISNSSDPSTNGTATCVGATSAPVKLTATTGSGANVKTATDFLTCN